MLLCMFTRVVSPNWDTNVEQLDMGDRPRTYHNDHTRHKTVPREMDFSRSAEHCPVYVRCH